MVHVCSTLNAFPNQGEVPGGGRKNQGIIPMEQWFLSWHLKNESSLSRYSDLHAISKESPVDFHQKSGRGLGIISSDTHF